MKGSLRKSLKWIKNTYTQAIYGGWWWSEMVINVYFIYFFHFLHVTPSLFLWLYCLVAAEFHNPKFWLGLN
jgi:hypothetical protein